MISFNLFSQRMCKAMEDVNYISNVVPNYKLGKEKGLTAEETEEIARNGFYDMLDCLYDMADLLAAVNSLAFDMEVELKRIRKHIYG